MFLIAGLGNPGPRYQWTRHNAGWIVLDRLAEKLAVGAGDWEEKHKSRAARARVGGVDVLLVKPLTFMNLSGAAVGPWMQFFKIPVGQVLVVVDEYALPFGRLRVRPSGSDGGHNGLKSIQEQIGAAYPRVRIGVHAEHGQIPMADFVLHEFTAEEKKGLPRVADAGADCILDILSRGVAPSMNTWNGFKIFGEAP